MRPLILPALALALLALSAADGGDERPGVCWVLESAHAGYASGGGLSLLRQHCGPDAGAAPSAERRAASHPARTGSNVLVNDPSADAPPQTTQSETTIARCGGVLLAAWNDSGSSRFGSFTGYARSTDGGDTWTDMGPLPGLSGSDPVLVADRYCRFYFAAIAMLGGCSGVGVIRSDDGGLTWSAPANAAEGTPCNNFQDKEWIAVDNTAGPHQDNVYLCWDDRGGTEIRLLFSRSTDGGRSFSPPLTLSSFPFGFATGCQVQVAPNGTVYVVWTEGNSLEVLIRASSDGGLSFGPRTLVARTQVLGQFKFCGENIRPTLNGDIRTFNWPSFVISPASGSLHVAWNDGRLGHGEVFHARSTDGGRSWSEPQRLSDDETTTDQFQPALAFTETGILRAVWYDRRLDPANNYLIDVFSAVSIDDGSSFSPSERITDVSFGVPPINPNFDPAVVECYMGDYNGIIGGDGTHYMVWGDNRNRVAGRPDPDVYFDKRDTRGLTMTVTRSDDPEPDGCRPGDCSLREAALAAATSPGPDVITLPAGHYRLSRSSTSDSAASDDIDLFGAVILRGAGANTTLIDAQETHRVLHIHPGAFVSVSGVTLTRGRTAGASGRQSATGAGLLNEGSLTLRGVVVQSSVSQLGAGAGIGNLGDLLIEHSTIWDNATLFNGGGIYNAGRLTVVNSTIWRNVAADGGGIYNEGDASLLNVTVSDNLRTGASGPPARSNLAGGGSLRAQNTLVAGSGDGANCGREVVSLGHNLEDNDSCGFDQPGDITGADPLLLTLDRRGGTTPVIAISQISPAADAGDDAACPPLDQRGFVRPVAAFAGGDARCDIGAFEFDSYALGDADCDGDTDAIDALALLRSAAGLTTPNCAGRAGDVDCDGLVDERDALALLRHIVLLPLLQQPGCPPIGPI